MFVPEVVAIKEDMVNCVLVAAVWAGSVVIGACLKVGRVSGIEGMAHCYTLGLF